MNTPETETATNPALLVVAQTKAWRKALDDILQEMKASSERTNVPIPGVVCRSSRERALSITKLQESIMWLGMDLKAQHVPNPYPHSYDPSSPVIDPTADNLKL